MLETRFSFCYTHCCSEFTKEQLILRMTNLRYSEASLEQLSCYEARLRQPIEYDTEYMPLPDIISIGQLWLSLMFLSCSTKGLQPWHCCQGKMHYRTSRRTLPVQHPIQRLTSNIMRKESLFLEAPGGSWRNIHEGRERRSPRLPFKALTSTGSSHLDSAAATSLLVSYTTNMIERTRECHVLQTVF